MLLCVKFLSKLWILSEEMWHCILVERYQCFRGKYCLNLQGIKVRDQKKNSCFDSLLDFAIIERIFEITISFQMNAMPTSRHESILQYQLKYSCCHRHLLQQYSGLLETISNNPRSSLTNTHKVRQISFYILHRDTGRWNYLSQTPAIFLTARLPTLLRYDNQMVCIMDRWCTFICSSLDDDFISSWTSVLIGQHRKIF